MNLLPVILGMGSTSRLGWRGLVGRRVEGGRGQIVARRIARLIVGIGWVEAFQAGGDEGAI